MEVRITYKGTQNGVKGIWCGFKPKGIKVEEELSILYPNVGKILKHRESGETFSSVLIENESDIQQFEEIDEETVDDTVDDTVEPETV